MAGDRRGPPKGTKRSPLAGRKKGTPNRRKTEDEERKRIAAENAARAVDIAKEEKTRYGPIAALKKKLAKDMIEDYMMAFHGQAARFQPLPPGTDLEEAARRGFTPDPKEFKAWGMLTVETARALAEYQSPKLRAVLMTMPGGEGGSGGPMKLIDQDGNNIIPRDDPIAAARTYARIMKTIEG